ncbi:MAG: diversity-generating retroelement protein Avd [SAR324 cluster bacterium]|uniref:Diversity-generating retroelement protein Avd n=1 Tax=SAR324 cluster bacterium TaxID=2024889 RepID=A0A7X9IMP0_9DELT|nr:diversity-generating retroelement protein Avd [SAR324 cluster bacterium]
MDAYDVPIIHKCSELFRLLHEYQTAIPKADRYTIWQRCQNLTLDILEGFLSAAAEEQNARMRRLGDVSVKLDMLRLLTRLSFELKAINNKKYLELQTHIEEIGKMLGGWLRHLRQK